MINQYLNLELKDTAYRNRVRRLLVFIILLEVCFAISTFCVFKSEFSPVIDGSEDTYHEDSFNVVTVYGRYHARRHNEYAIQSNEYEYIVWKDRLLKRPVKKLAGKDVELKYIDMANEKYIIELKSDGIDYITMADFIKVAKQEAMFAKYIFYPVVVFGFFIVSVGLWDDYMKKYVYRTPVDLIERKVKCLLKKEDIKEEGEFAGLNHKKKLNVESAKKLHKKDEAFQKKVQRRKKRKRKMKNR